MPALLGLIPTVRLLAADVATHAEFDLDALADLQMAVDEACNALISQAGPDQALWCVFTVLPDLVGMTMSVRSGSPHARVDTHGFGWHVLHSLVDRLDTHRGGGQDQDCLVIEMVKTAVG